MLKYIPALVLVAFALICFMATRAGDNSDARALSGIMMVPAIGFSVFAALAAAIAYL